MLEADTRTFLARARARRQVELSARLVAAGAPTGDHGAAERQAALWRDVQARVLEAVERHKGAGLRVLRAERTRAGLILTGTAAAWRSFLDAEAALVGDSRLEFRRYDRPWSYGLPGFPE
jgi:hypothetical protein